MMKGTPIELRFYTYQFVCIGQVGYLSLLTAEQTYQTAVVSLVQARANRYADTAALFQALGGGWWNRSDILSRSRGTAKASNNLESRVQDRSPPKIDSFAARQDLKF